MICELKNNNQTLGVLWVAGLSDTSNGVYSPLFRCLRDGGV